jgi:hypothetical protein
MDVPISTDPLIEAVATELYIWDSRLFSRYSDRYGAAKIAVDTLRRIAEGLNDGIIR